jgi:steroid delta-isomerase-like uncharacterized protein
MGAEMSVEQNKIIVQLFFEELWNNRNMNIADEIFAADCVTHQLRSGAEIVAYPRNADAVKKHLSEWLAGFPDLRFAVEQMVAEADQVMTRSVMQGTHTGTWLGIPPTGKQVGIRMITIHRIVSGRITEDWVLVESLGFFQQLGFLPATGEIMAGAANRLRR